MEEHQLLYQAVDSTGEGAGCDEYGLKIEQN
jgi:hypothetical protein